MVRPLLYGSGMTTKTLLVPFCLMSFAACTSSSDSTTIPQTNLKDGGVSITMLSEQPGTLTLWLKKTGHNPGRNAAKVSDCVRVSDQTTIAANLVPGTLDDPGAFDDGDLGFETNCIDPMLEVPLDNNAQAIDIVINDGTVAMHVVIEKDSFGSYKVDRCDADSCKWFR